MPEDSSPAPTTLPSRRATTDPVGVPDALLTVTETVARSSITVTEAGLTVAVTVAFARSTGGASVTVSETWASPASVAASP